MERPRRTSSSHFHMELVDKTIRQPLFKPVLVGSHGEAQFKCWLTERVSDVTLSNTGILTHRETDYNLIHDQSTN